MAEVQCPHCGGANVLDAAFCEACGKALPTNTGPRLVADSELASTSAGRSVQQIELAKTMKKAFGALLALGIIHLIGAFVLPEVLASDAAKRGIARSTIEGELTRIRFIILGIGAGFLALSFWARYSPFPAAIVGLVAYVSLLLLDAIADPSQIYKGIILKIIIIAVLTQAIQAGIRHRKLVQEMDAG